MAEGSAGRAWWRPPERGRRRAGTSVRTEPASARRGHARHPDAVISQTLATYLERYPDEAEALSAPLRMLAGGSGFASRRSFPMHMTVGALLVRGGREILLIEHRAYGITLQPGGHLEPTDATLVDAAVRELAEETGLDPAGVTLADPVPAYVEYGRVPARPEKGEPDHFHLDLGYAFTTDRADVGRIQEAEVTGAAWVPLADAERLVGPRIARAVSRTARVG
ncbi:NUDIX hydrolase [Streptomyces anulatus]|uniref:NUDIX hydrolase n=1 Tax=Streptomyces anulatus TaxID=1892 RepID=UPI00225059D6|nr:NUDIX domain-containing protein [Streptomyces anulatus]MCX4507996.1 NUDIX domain-containing protein [Streptomyces anulatus]